MNLLDFETNRKVQNFINFMFHYSMIRTVNKPTRVVKNSFSAIDHVITNSLLYTRFKMGIIKADISDHFPIYFACKTIDRTEQPNKQEILKRFYNKEQIQNSKQQLCETD